jgi:predicted Fe-Mo cluster-binding NifX family protein
MKIAFPSLSNMGLLSAVHGHFGSAPFFIVVDADGDDVAVLDNHDLNHAHDKCQPLAALGGQTVDAVAVGGIGGGALKKLTAAGITIYRAVEGTVAENLELVKSGKLPEFDPFHTCAGHTGDAGCSH